MSGRRPDVALRLAKAFPLKPGEALGHVDVPARPALESAGRLPRVYPYRRMARLLPGSRQHEQAVLLTVMRDVSASVEETDPRGASRHDVEDVIMPWMAREMPDDLIAVGIFDDAADCAPATSAAAALKARAGAGLPRPGHGGTSFVPAVMQAIHKADQHPDALSLVALVTDGWGSDVEQADALLGSRGLQGIVVPFGPQFPFISAGWQDAHHITFAEHVDTRPHGIAHTLADALIELTGHTRCS